MRRTASEVLNELELRVASLEKEAIFGLFKGKKPTIKSEEDLLKKSIEGLRGISEVSVDLSDPDNLEMVITYEGEDFYYYRGRCLVDNYGIYGGSKTASSNLIFQQARNDRSRRNRGRGVGTGILNLEAIEGNKYRFGIEIDLITEKGRVVEGLDSLHRDVISYYEGRKREEARKKELAFKQNQREMSERARLDREERKRLRREQLSRR